MCKSIHVNCVVAVYFCLSCEKGQNDVDFEVERLWGMIENATETCALSERHPIILLEGLDGVGKSTIAQELHNQIKGSKLMKTPPKELDEFRKFFDKQQESVRRSFYMFGNILASMEMADFATNHGPVIIDRYYPSTIAYQTATELMNSVDQTSTEVLLYPNFLVVPKFTFLLEVNENLRRSRLHRRAPEQITVEEAKLEEQKRFRELVMHYYKCVQGVIVINADDDVQQVISRIMKILQNSTA